MEPVLSECIQGQDINTDVVEEERVVANYSALGSGGDGFTKSFPSSLVSFAWQPWLTARPTVVHKLMQYRTGNCTNQQHQSMITRVVIVAKYR